MLKIRDFRTYIPRTYIFRTYIVWPSTLDFSARQTALETVYGAPPQVFLPFLVEPEQQQIALDAAALDKMTARYISYFREKEKGEQPF